MWSYFPNHPSINASLSKPILNQDARTSMLFQPARYTFVKTSSSAIPRAIERNPSRCVVLICDMIDSARRSLAGRDSISLRMVTSNSVMGASMQANGGSCSGKRVWKTLLREGSSTSASSLRTISACETVSSLAVLCASESQTTACIPHRGARQRCRSYSERGTRARCDEGRREGRQERMREAGATHVTPRRRRMVTRCYGPSTWLSH